jgi:hypothetical protein
MGRRSCRVNHRQTTCAAFLSAVRVRAPGKQSAISGNQRQEPGTVENPRRDSRESEISYKTSSNFLTAAAHRSVDACRMTYARSILVPPGSPGTYHCVSRCVRRAWLRRGSRQRPFDRRLVEDRIGELAWLPVAVGCAVMITTCGGAGHPQVAQRSAARALQRYRLVHGGAADGRLRDPRKRFSAGPVMPAGFCWPPPGFQPLAWVLLVPQSHVGSLCTNSSTQKSTVRKCRLVMVSLKSTVRSAGQCRS